MTEESSYMTLSLHLSKAGAEKAVEIHRAKTLSEWKQVYPTKKDEPFPFGTFEDWMIIETEVLP